MCAWPAGVMRNRVGEVPGKAWTSAALLSGRLAPCRVALTVFLGVLPLQATAANVLVYGSLLILQANMRLEALFYSNRLLVDNAHIDIRPGPFHIL